MLTTFNSIQGHTDLFHEANDCTVKALAIAVNTSYEISHEAFHDAGRTPRKGTNDAMYKQAFKNLGYDLVEIQVPLMRRFSKKGMTVSLGTSKNNKVPRKGTYVVRTTSHLYVIRDGVAECPCDKKSYRIQNVYKVVKAFKPARQYTGSVHMGGAMVERKQKYIWVIQHKGGIMKCKRMTKFIDRALKSLGVRNSICVGVSYEYEYIDVNWKNAVCIIRKERVN